MDSAPQSGKIADSRQGPDQLGDVQAAGVVDVDGRWGQLEHTVAILETEDVAVGPVAQAAVLGEYRVVRDYCHDIGEGQRDRNLLSSSLIARTGASSFSVNPII